MTHPVPIEAILDGRLGIVGGTGSGKTYSAGTMVELLLQRGERTVIVDPLGAWWGLRLDRHGKQSQFDLPIFGGKHGDLPLVEGSGKVIGETVAGMQQSCILDLSQIGTKAAERRFMLPFLTALYSKQKDSLLHTVFDEADMWAPQVLLDKDGDAAKLLGMMETIVRRGRIRGFVPWMITQRPAVLSKNVLSQVDGVISFKLTSSQDRDALSAWVEGQADKAEWKQTRSELAGLDRGTGLIWLPGRNIMKQATFPEKLTYDSSRAPKRGEVREAVVLKPLDLDDLKSKLQSIETEAKTNDPKALKAEIARLKAECQNHIGAATDAQTEKAFKSGFENGLREGYMRGLTDIGSAIAAYIPVVIQQNLEAAQTASPHMFAQAFKETIKDTVSKLPNSPAMAGGTKVEGRDIAPNKAVPPRTDIDGLSDPQRKVVRSLLFWSGLNHRTPTREQVAAISGYSPTSGNFSNILSQLKATGKVSYPYSGKVELAGEVALEDVIYIDEARAILGKTLSDPQKKIVAAVVSAPHNITRERLAADTSYSATSGNFSNLLGQLRTLDILTYPSKGIVALSNWAREVLS